MAKVFLLDDYIEENDKELTESFKNLVDLFQIYISDPHNQPESNLLLDISNDTSLPTSVDLIVAHLNLRVEGVQQFIETISIKKRIEMATEIIITKIKASEFKNSIRKRVGNRLNKKEKEFILREELKEIEKELAQTSEDEFESGDPEIKEIQKKIKDSKLPDIAMKSAKRELKRLQRVNPASPDYAITRDYLDWVLNLPWDKSTKAQLDIHKAEEELNKDHYGLKEAKERIIEYLATLKMAGDKAKGQILCFFGPPGVGKTSIVKSIARAMNREFVRFPLGGMRDEAEVRGHRRTYVGAMPGRIIQRLRRAGVNNPVIMLDEIDKIGTDFRGDPASALLEVLDPEQNSEFNDHYLDIPFDLSNCFFITTANDISTIPPALKDRLEIIEFVSYTEDEKVNIAINHLLPKVLDAHGLDIKNIKISKETMTDIISLYTREAGIRNLERVLSKIARKVVREFVDKNTKNKTISTKDLYKYLGPGISYDDVNKIDAPGQALGLAWTSVGGSMVPIEVVAMKGKGDIKITGQLGDVMKESTQIAISYLRSNYKKFGLKEDFFKDKDLHIHAPEGAVKKEGPSAGVTLTSAIWSLFANTKLKSDVAMTGEITLTGKVLAIGGIREKALAALKNGIKHVIVPKSNEKDVKKILEDYGDVLKDITFHFAGHFDDVLKVVAPSKKK